MWSDALPFVVAFAIFPILGILFCATKRAHNTKNRNLPMSQEVQSKEDKTNPGTSQEKHSQEKRSRDKLSAEQNPSHTNARNVAPSKQHKMTTEEAPLASNRSENSSASIQEKVPQKSSQPIPPRQEPLKQSLRPPNFDLPSYSTIEESKSIRPNTEDDHSMSQQVSHRASESLALSED
ncbi:hypothetical protein L596_028028 [Steinernema carpocapsae]|uniref:Uncharacterized protein n=1 Tax=Steinernema carpocapsae TaxID=34508 RepID=A0A4U5LX87_STECR|nr:hypothetical protein L596_028028 [Steinernema carpocapsae]